MILTSVSLNIKIKDKLKEFKENEGCSSYSDAINLLLERNSFHKGEGDDN